MGEEGMSPLREACVQLHEMYSELKHAGFSRGEAMELVARVLAEQATVQNRDNNGE